MWRSNWINLHKKDSSESLTRAIAKEQRAYAKLATSHEMLVQRLEQRKKILSEELAVIDNNLTDLRNLNLNTSTELNCFVISSMMLRHSYEYCTQDEAEGMHFIAGVVLNGVRIGTQFISFPYQYRSIAGASGDQMATHRIGIHLHDWEHKYVAMIHSHPRGCSNNPSSTDRRTQDLWEKTTKIIGGIWDREGRIRFYSNRLPFRVEIPGNYVEKLDENLYLLKLEEIDPLPKTNGA
jgi:hypothetical protein